MSEPQPGTIGLTTISGEVGRAIRIGQWLNGEGFAQWEHAFILLPANQVLEAEPGGAVIRPYHYQGADVYWCTGIRQLLALPAEPTDAELSATAAPMQGIPYSFADYAALAAHRLHAPWPGLQDFIEDSGHEICSQLCDDYYYRLGAHVFDDGRWSGFVTPASLYRRDLELALAA